MSLEIGKKCWEYALFRPKTARKKKEYNIFATAINL
jgi:hypothetical protein